MAISTDKRWSALIILFSERPLSFEEGRKRLLFGAAGSFTALILTYFAFVRLIDMNYVLSFVNGCAASIILFSIWRAFKKEDASKYYQTFAAVGAILLCISASRGDAETHRMLWLYVYVPVVFFLLGSKLGFLFSLLPAFAWMLALFVPSAISGPAVYGHDISIRFMFTLFLLITSNWYFETVRGIYSRSVNKRHSELENDREEMQGLAFSDELTGLPNRRSVVHFVDDSLAMLSYDNSKSAMLVMLDIDHFKVVNDQHGHKVGDMVLVEVARRISNAIRSGDFVGRFGGEEFLVVLPSEAAPRYREIVEKIRQAVCATPIAINSIVLRVTVSIGATELSKELTREQLIERADKALYAAKQNGRNQSLFYGEKNYLAIVRKNVSQAS